MRRIGEVQRRFGRLMRHEFPKALHEFLLILALILARNILGLVNEAQGVQKKALAAGAVGGGES